MRCRGTELLALMSPSFPANFNQPNVRYRGCVTSQFPTQHQEKRESEERKLEDEFIAKKPRRLASGYGGGVQVSVRTPTRLPF